MASLKTSSIHCRPATRYAHHTAELCTDRMWIDLHCLQTDASRARTVELHIQARVSQELKKLQQKETEALNLAHEKLAAAAASSGSGDDQKPSSFTVSKEIDELQKKLDGRKTLRPLPDGVEKARGKVVRCLRENDRRPLDCWQEVESFKAEVRRLEKEWVDKASS